MRLDNKTFKIGTLCRRRRRKLGRISNFKWLEAALNLVEIKIPFGSVQTYPQVDSWWVPLFILFKKCFLESLSIEYVQNVTLSLLPPILLMNIWDSIEWFLFLPPKGTSNYYISLWWQLVCFWQKKQKRKRRVLEQTPPTSMSRQTRPGPLSKKLLFHIGRVAGIA